ncbi:hypothetical protein LSCM1_00182 [Leishmania martiniquensis]|uniref:Uncharacterized protein n=1 Tax=Leishmania martiniquensis TaxID=1580590 RepID=A0A836KFU3_9TRYP|nr:hypothetical protein LSCM1_00182 [Leishmania martiniquensis]
MLEIQAYLNALDAARADRANAGLHGCAQLCRQRMEKAIHLLTKRSVREADAVAERTRQGLTDQRQVQQRILRKRWSEKMLVYQQNASEMLAAVKQRYNAESVQGDAHTYTRDCAARVQAIARPLSCSSEVQHLQRKLQQRLRQHCYREAGLVEAQISRLVEREH